MASQELLDWIFSVRITLMDEFVNEKDIIIELKYFLRNKEYNPDETNDILIQFYKQYNVPIPDDFIKSIHIPELVPPPISLPPTNNNYNIVYQGNQYIVTPYIQPADEPGEDNDVASAEAESSLPESSVPLPESSEPLPPAPPIIQAPINSLTQEQITNMFINFMNNSAVVNPSYLPANPAPLVHQDILVTCDKKDLHELKKFKFEIIGENKYNTFGNVDTCSICKCDFEKDDELLETPCHHTFHFECIDYWLNNNSNKCPNCRKECGKSLIHD